MSIPSRELPLGAIIRPCGTWTLYEWSEAFSTNDLGRLLPPWSIARALEQTGGRGRMNRKWHSGKGGLWMSFVVPLTGDNSDWGPLPLIAGLSILDLMEQYSIKDARLRWPNDLLVNNQKLAGILVERPSPDKAVIGIGLNVTNDISSAGDEHNTPTRLADIHPSFLPAHDEILLDLATCLRTRFQTFSDNGLAPLLPDFAKIWEHPRPVRVETCDGSMEGLFTGINSGGHPLLKYPDGTESFVDGAYITRLKEI